MMERNQLWRWTAYIWYIVRDSDSDDDNIMINSNDLHLKKR